MVLVPAALALIKEFESLHDGDLSVIGLQPKMCPAGVWTVGYGRALRYPGGAFVRGISGRAEAYRQYPNLSEAEAEAMLLEDTEEFSRWVAKRLRVEVTPNQFGAMVSLAYNIGIFAFYDSTVLRRVNAGRFDDAADAFLMWNKSGGKVLAGLVRRRHAERRLFLAP